MNISKPFYLLLMGVLFIGIVIGVVLTSQLDLPQRGVAHITVVDDITLGSTKGVSSELLNLQSTSRAFVQIAKEVVPTVVSIRITRHITASDLKKFHDQEGGPWDFFNRRFFRFRIPRDFRLPGGTGSGIIVHPDGYILTNTHVVENADEIKVTLYDRRSFEAEVVGVDPLTEVAVVKIDGRDLPTARLGNSDKLEVGEWVLAIGNPLELHFTVTAGIVSAIGRQMNVISDNFGIENFIQTDAVINPGNSGGALVNLRGEVIGVNTLIATRSGYYEGYGFAIPINLAREIMKDLITKGRVIRAYLGIAMLPVDEKTARAFHMEKPRGVFIDNLLEDGPAKRAGVKPEDILLAIDSLEVNAPNQVQTYIAEHDPGDVVVLTLLRKGQKIRIQVTLGEKEIKTTYKKPSRKPRKSYRNLGIEDVETVDRKMAEELGHPDLEGVIVRKLEAFSPAAEAGLLENDVILKINDRRIRSKGDFQAALKRLRQGQVAVFEVQRGDRQTHLFIEVL